MNTGFFEEAPGVKSLTRLQSFMLLCFFIALNTAFAIAQYKVMSQDKPLPPIDSNIIWFNCVILAFAFFPKVAQKLLEMKYGIKDDGSNSGQQK